MIVPKTNDITKWQKPITNQNDEDVPLPANPEIINIKRNKRQISFELTGLPFKYGENLQRKLLRAEYVVNIVDTRGKTVLTTRGTYDQYTGGGGKEGTLTIRESLELPPKANGPLTIKASVSGLYDPNGEIKPFKFECESNFF